MCPKVGCEWRALSTYLNIPTTTVDKLLESHKHDVNEAFFRVLSVWRQREGATWDQLLQAMRETGLNAPVRELLEWMSSGAASVSCVVVMHTEPYQIMMSYFKGTSDAVAEYCSAVSCPNTPNTF